MKRTLAIVTETFPPEINGVALTLQQKVTHLIGNGHTVQVIRPRQSCDQQGESDAAYQQLLVRGLPLPGYPDLKFGLPSYRKIYHFWQQQKPDAIYIATEGPLGRSALKAAKKLDIPVLTGFHTNFHQYSRHYRVGWLEGIIFRYLRQFHNQTYATLAPTHSQIEALNQLGIHNTLLLGRGIDCQRFNPQRRSAALRNAWGLDDDDLAILHVGRLAAEKNIELAVRAFIAIKQQRPDARFILVGDGPIAPSLKSKYPDFIFCGMQTGIELAEHYASADIMLFPSKTETFGNVLLEGMASGLALVAFNYAAGKQHIVSMQSGLLAPLDDDHRFCEHAVDVACNTTLRNQIRNAARDIAAEISWEAIIAQFEQYCEQAIQHQQQQLNKLAGETVNES